MTTVDVNHKANRLVKLHVDNLKEGYYVLIDMLREVESPWISHRLSQLLQDTKEEARDIYIRSNMKVPEWCRHE